MSIEYRFYNHERDFEEIRKYQTQLLKERFPSYPQKEIDEEVQEQLVDLFESDANQTTYLITDSNIIKGYLAFSTIESEKTIIISKVIKFDKSKKYGEMLLNYAIDQLKKYGNGFFETIEIIPVPSENRPLEDLRRYYGKFGFTDGKIVNCMYLHINRED